MVDTASDRAAGGETRPRYAWNLHEASGALGDLGTFLPHIIGAITVVGMDPTGLFVGFGLFYALSGAVYGIPMAVQPMKAASAAILIQPMDPASVAASGLIIGAFFLVVGATGLVSRIARVLPETIAAGLQLGLGLSLAALGVHLMTKTPWLGAATCLLMIGLMRFRRVPVALVAVVAGAVVGVLTGASPPRSARLASWLLHPPRGPIWETEILGQALNGLEHAVLPQIPLTLTNAIIVTAAVSRQLFPERAGAITERRLAITTGLGNLLAAPFGGYMMCHGAGGISGHFRFGARTATAPLLIGALFLALGLFLGSSGFGLLRTVPDAVLGGLLAFSGIDLAVSSRPGRFKDEDLFLVLLMAAVGVAINPAAAFVVGVPLAYGIKRHWVRV